MYELKLATNEHIDSILYLLKEFYKSSPYAHLPYDDLKVHELITTLLTSSKEDKIIILGIKDNIPIGLIIGQTTQSVFANQKIGLELAWWVDPEHRGSSIGLKLLRAYEDWCLRVGCQIIQMSLLGPSQAILGPIYERLGYRLIEQAYFKEI